MISRAALVSFQKSGAMARASSSASIFRRLSTSKITSHLYQSFAQLVETAGDVLDGNHVLRLPGPFKGECGAIVDFGAC
jgi:hypothetical protein